MKLSEMPADQAFEAMGKMIPHVAAILEDPAVGECKKLLKEKNANGAQMLSRAVPLIFSSHPDDIFAVVAAATGHTEEDVRSMPLSQVKEAFDEAWADVLDFFPFCLRLVANA